MSLYLFLLIVVSLSCGSLPASGTDLLRASTASVGMISGWVLLCHVGARVAARHTRIDDLDPVKGARWLEIQQNAFRWLGLGVVLLCLGGFGLAGELNQLSLLRHSMLAQGIVLLTPGLAILGATWSAERYFRCELGLASKSLTNHIASLWTSFRCGAGWLLVPVALVLAGADLVSLLPFGGEAVTVASVLLLFVLAPLGLPWLVRFTFPTQRLSTTTEAWMGELLKSAGLKPIRCLRWETEGRTFNAMVAGFVPGLRALLVSDRLLDELPREQLAMVVLHEAAHLRRFHVPLRMLAVLPAWGAGVWMTHLFGDFDWAAAAGSMGGVILTMLLLRLVSYRTEFDADAHACTLAVRAGNHVDRVPRSQEAAAAALSAALLRVTADAPAARRASWLHPSLARRLDALDRAGAARLYKDALPPLSVN